MTNDVEKLILINMNEKSNVKFEQNIAYLFYKEIWNFLLFVNNYDYNKLNIKIDIAKNGDGYYISKESGIKYQLIGNNFKCYYSTYYSGCNKDNINNILNNNIDLRLLFKLLYMDGFEYDYLFDDDNFELYITIYKCNVKNNIDNVLLKNKVLKKEL